MTGRICTLNRWNVSEPCEVQMALVRACIERLRPDVLGLQEIVVRRDDAWRIGGDGGASFTWDNRNRLAAYTFDPERRIDCLLVGLPRREGGRGRIESARLAFAEAADGPFPSDQCGIVVDLRG